MDTQTQIQTTPAWSLQFMVMEEASPVKPQQYSAYDFGFESDPEEICAWMAIEYSNGSFDYTPQIEAGEFESLNHWFIS